MSSAETLSDSRLVTFVPIKDMKRAIKFYTHVLGAKLMYQGEGEMRDTFASVKVGRNEFWLIVPSAKEKRELAYTAFHVKDIRAVVKDLRKRGLSFKRAERMGPDTKVEGPLAIEPFGISAFFKDSEGNLLMIWQNIPPM